MSKYNAHKYVQIRIYMRFLQHNASCCMYCDFVDAEFVAAISIVVLYGCSLQLACDFRLQFISTTARVHQVRFYA